MPVMKMSAQARDKFEAEHRQLAGETWAWREKVQRSMDGAGSGQVGVRLKYVWISARSKHEAASMPESGRESIECRAIASNVCLFHL